MVHNPIFYGFSTVSWSGILAGTVTALAIWMIMSIIGLALGFKIVSPKSDNPAQGLGKTMGGWTAASVIVSLAGGGFMAGMLAGQRGLAHGFLVWAVVTIVLMLASGHALGLALKGAFSVIQGVGSGAATLAGTAASAGKDAAQSALDTFSHLKDSLDLDLDLDAGQVKDKLNDNIAAVLRDTGNEKLRPEYLKGQLRETRRDLKTLIRQASLDPTQAETLFNNFLETVKSRVKDLTGDLDKETAVTTLMNNRNLPREDAEKMVDNALKAYDQAADQARETLDDLEAQISEAKDHLKMMADQARAKADQATNVAAKGAAALAAAMIIAALLSMGFGLWGVKCAEKWYSATEVIVTTR